MFTKSMGPGYALIEICEPTSANALSITAARELAALRGPGPLVVRSRHPRVFCSGGHLGDHARQDAADVGLRHNAEIAAVLDAFAAWPGPKLAMIEGEALGGGVEWLARFDYRWCTPAARLTFWQKRVGLTPGWGGGRAWAGLIGERSLKAILLEARPMSAPESLRRGLIDRVINPDAIDTELERWAREVASPIDDDIARWTAADEDAHFRKLWWGPAHRAALDAWAKRRPS